MANIKIPDLDLATNIQGSDLLILEQQNGTYKAEVRSLVTTDQTYDPTSANAQSGVAVASGISSNIDQAYDGTSTKAQSGVAVASAISTKANATHSHGAISNDGAIATNVVIANGDRLLISDSDNSNLIRRASITFDDTTTTQFLSKKGTWVSVLTAFPKVNVSNLLFSRSQQSGSWSYTNSNYDLVVCLYTSTPDFYLDNVRIDTNTAGFSGNCGVLYLKKNQTIKCTTSSSTTQTVKVFSATV